MKENTKILSQIVTCLFEDDRITHKQVLHGEKGKHPGEILIEKKGGYV